MKKKNTFQMSAVMDPAWDFMELGYFRGPINIMYAHRIRLISCDMQPFWDLPLISWQILFSSSDSIAISMCLPSGLAEDKLSS